MAHLLQMSYVCKRQIIPSHLSQNWTKVSLKARFFNSTHDLWIMLSNALPNRGWFSNPDLLWMVSSDSDEQLSEGWPLCVNESIGLGWAGSPAMVNYHWGNMFTFPNLLTHIHCSDDRRKNTSPFHRLHPNRNTNQHTSPKTSTNSIEPQLNDGFQ